MIRPIRREDTFMIKRICESVLNHKTTEELIELRISELSANDHYYIRVFEDDDSKEVLGFIQAEKYNLLYGENGWNIIALAVDLKAQGRGIGKSLLSSLENYSTEIGYTFIRLNSRTERKDAHTFYEHLGYVCDKTQKRFIKKI